ncbi:PE family protein, partial [Mycobacterium ulcerans]
MTLVDVVPGMVQAAANDLAGLNTTLNAANAAAATQITTVVAAAQDEVSAAIAAQFSGHGLAYQQLSTQVGVFSDQFVAALSASASGYSAAEAANTGPLQQLLTLINAPLLAATGRPLIGNGALMRVNSCCSGPV